MKMHGMENLKYLYSPIKPNCWRFMKVIATNSTAGRVNGNREGWGVV